MKITDRIYRTLLRGRSEPIETILALSAILHGLWLTVPYWATRGSVEVTPAPRSIELGISIALFVLGALHLLFMYFRKESLRRLTSLFKFVAWLFFAILSYFATGPDSIIWIGYSTIACISAVVYLNISVRDLK